VEFDDKKGLGTLGVKYATHCEEHIIGEIAGENVLVM